jgi:hypothetical protein
MFSSYLRSLSTQQYRRFTWPSFSKKPEPANQPQADTFKLRLNPLPIMSYGHGSTNGYFVSFTNVPEKRATLAQLQGCDYTIIYEFPENACFSGLVATIFRFVYVFIFMIS